MKKLPPSWLKSKNNQLSFADTLLNKPTKEDIFVERLTSEFHNLKYLRYRASYAKIKKLENLSTYAHLSTALEAGSRLLGDLCKKTKKFRHKTEDTFLMELFVEKITWAPTEALTWGELKESHEHAKQRIIGMFLANKDLLKKNRRDVKTILQCLEDSHIILYRLNVI